MEEKQKENSVEHNENQKKKTYKKNYRKNSMSKDSKNTKGRKNNSEEKITGEVEHKVAVAAKTVKEIEQVIEEKEKKIKKSRKPKIVNNQKGKNFIEAKFERRNKPIIDLGFKKSNLKIIALGGIDEIGKNITVFEYEDEIILVDCGLEFPEDDMLGVDLVIPDVTYLVKNKDKIKGLCITHGHEDHIGSIPYVLKQVNMPIYATKLTARLISHKLEEHHLLNSAQINIVEQGQTVDFGKMQVEFIRSSHSIPDAVMLAIHTPVGTVIHTGDFK